MASSFNFYGDMFNKLNDLLSSYVSDVASSVIGSISPIATSLLTLYVILWGWSMARGIIQEPIMDGLQRAVRLAIITGIALNVGTYNKYLSDALWQSPDALAKVVAGGEATGSTQFLDQQMGQIWDLGDAYSKAAHADSTMGIPDLTLLVTAYAIWATGIAITAYGAFLFALSKMMLALLLGVGPLFILGTIFDATKRFFDTWIGQALNYVFLAMLTAGVIKIILKIMEMYLTKVSAAGVQADPSVPAALPAIVFCIIGVLVLTQVPSLASALGGGVAVSSLGAVAWAYGRARGGLSAMRPSNMRRSYNRAKSDVRVLKDVGKAVGGAPLAAYRKVTGQKNRVSKG